MFPNAAVAPGLFVAASDSKCAPSPATSRHLPPPPATSPTLPQDDEWLGIYMRVSKYLEAEHCGGSAA